MLADSLHVVIGAGPTGRGVAELLRTVLGCLGLPGYQGWLEKWERPYEVDHSKFAARFWDDCTPLEDGIRETVRWYQSLER